MKLKNSNCDETQKLALWWDSKTQILLKLKNSNSDKTDKIKLWQISNCDKTEIVKEKELNNSKCDKTQNVTKLKLWPNSKTWIVTKLKSSNCDKAWIMTNLNLWETRRGSLVDRRPSTAEAPPTGKIQPFSKMAVTFEPLIGFWCPLGFRKVLITMT